MEMGGRGLSELFRNTSEEIFLKAVMENSVAAAPSMEMLGFRNMSQSFREDSEELFNSWLMNGEIPGFSSLNNRPRQPSRLSSEAAGLPNQQHDLPQQNFLSDNLIPQNSAPPPEYSTNHNLQTLKNAAEKGLQASDLLLAKTWFHCTQPMTRSRSSELRRRYAAMQCNLSPITTETTKATNQVRLDFTNTNSANSTPMGNTPVQTPTFVSPSCSSTSPLDNPHMVAHDTVTSVVSMLKDTLERKKLGSHANMDTTSHGNSFGYYDNQQFQQNILGGANIFPQGTIAHVEDSLMLSDIRKSTEHNTGNFVYPANQVWISAVSREPSQSGSSNAMTTQSAGYEVCDELPAMGQALSVCESTRRNTANGTADCRSKRKEYRERVLKQNLKDDRKRVTLTQMGSISSEQADTRVPIRGWGPLLKK